MKLYTYDPAPNPRRLTLFLKYKGIELDTEQVDLMARQQLTDDYLAIVPQGTVPALVLENGHVLTEVIGICHYLETLHPERPLLGTTALEKAEIVSWNHRLYVGFLQSIANVFRNQGEAFADRALPGALNLPQIPELVTRGRLQLEHIIPELDAHIATTQWVAGDKPSMADIDLLACINFLSWIKQDIPDHCEHLIAWQQRASAEFG